MLVEGSQFYRNIRLAELKVLDSSVGALQPATALDIGCGTGDAVMKLVRAGCRVEAIDFSFRMVHAARARCAPFGDRARVTCGDMSDAASWPAGPFDIVTAFSSVINHLSSPLEWTELFARARATISPRGRFIFTMDNMLGLDSLGWLSLNMLNGRYRRRSLRDIGRSIHCLLTATPAYNEWPIRYRHQEMGLHLSYLPVHTVTALLQNAGFTVVEKRGVNALASLDPRVMKSSTYQEEPYSRLGAALSSIDRLASRRLAPLAANVILCCERSE